MGLCFSKKQQAKRREGQPSDDTKKSGGKKAGRDSALAAEAKKTGQAKASAPAPPKKALTKPEEPAADKRKVFVVKAAAAAAGKGEQEEEVKRATPDDEAKPVQVGRVPVRTSSCTKEEVDAILIQCGRLSRSSSASGKAPSGEHGGGHRRYAGSKRSYDFDQERRTAGGADEQECDWERQGVAAVSRPSPHRGSPQRRRSGSRERSGGGGSRRASQSPGRRAEGGASAAATASSGGGERARQQPGKMVSVPAREKGRAPSPAAASGKRCASPRSSSPARMAVGNENAGGGPAAGPTPSLSRSSSRKAEQSPYRRNPMAELDENSLLRNNNNSAKPQKKSTENAVSAPPQKVTERGKEQMAAPSGRSGKEKSEIAEDVAAASETRMHSSKTNATRTVSIVAESLNQMPAGCRSRRASRDFDQNSNSYATQLLEDIQNYHEQHQTTSTGATAATPSFSLPACVAKACSILEAVADLNSSSSENRTYEYEPGRSADDKGSVNALSGRDDRVELSVRKHVPPVRDIRGETEPQESAGSNSVSGHPWTQSLEPTSVESTDRTWSTGDEVVEQGGSHGAPSPMNQPRQSKQRPSQPEHSSRSRAGSGNGNSLHRGRSAHRGSGSVASGRSGVRVVSATS